MTEKKILTLNRINISGTPIVNCTVGYIIVDGVTLYTVEKRFNYDNVRKYGIQGNSCIPEGRYNISIENDRVYLSNNTFLSILPNGSSINRSMYFFNKENDNTMISNGISIGETLRIESGRPTLLSTNNALDKIKKYIIKNSINEIEIKLVNK